MSIRLYFGPHDPNADPNFLWISRHDPVYSNPAITVAPVSGSSAIDIRLSLKNHGAPSANPVTVKLCAATLVSDPSDAAGIAAELKAIVEAGVPLAPIWSGQIVPAYSASIPTEWVIPGMGKRRWTPPSARYVIVAKVEYTGATPITPQLATESDDYSRDPHVAVWIQF